MSGLQTRCYFLRIATFRRCIVTFLIIAPYEYSCLLTYLLRWR